MRVFLLALVALLFAAGEPALAQTASWRVSEASGDVRIIEGGASRPATRGALLSGGSVVATAQRARAVLVRGRDYVIVSPASRVRLPTAAQGGALGLVQMIAEAGTALYRIEHRATPHFAVRTPYLAAVVKGTVFTVTVSEAGASVQVTEGAVEVSTADGGAAEMVRPGSIATVSAADLQQLNIQGETSRSIRSNGAPAAGAVVVPPSEVGNYQGPADSRADVVASVTEEPVALAEVTGGLVEGNAGVDLALVDVRDEARPNAGGSGETGNGGGPGNPGNGGGPGAGGPGPGPGAGGPGAGGPGPGGGPGAGGPGPGGGGPGPGAGDSGPGAGGPGPGGGPGAGGSGPGAGGPGPGGGPGAGGPGAGGPGPGDGGPGTGGGPGAGDDDNSGPGNGGDDGNNGHGNDDDGDDASNPGNGGGNGNGGDDGNNGHGNDDDGDDASNPGNGGGNGNSGPGNGGDDDADDDNSGPGHGGGPGGGHGGGPGGGSGGPHGGHGGDD